MWKRKSSIVDAIMVNLAISRASKDWKSLPDWLRNEYEKGNILFGIRQIDLNSNLTGFIGSSAQINEIIVFDSSRTYPFSIWNISDFNSTFEQL